MLKDNMLKLGLQYFAEETDDADETTTEVEQPEEQQEDKTFTQDELDKIVQDRLSREQKKFKEQQEQAIATAISEGKRLAQLSAEERAAEEAKQKEQSLLEREQELARRELAIDTQSRLAEDNIPQQFAGFLMATDADTTNDNIKAFKAEFDKAVSEAVEQRLKDSVTVPKAGGAMRTTKSDFNIQDFQNKNRLIK